MAVISDTFRGRRRIDATALLLEKTRGLGVDLQPVGLALEDLRSGDPPGRAVLAEGRLLTGE